MNLAQYAIARAARQMADKINAGEALTEDEMTAARVLFAEVETMAGQRPGSKLAPGYDHVKMALYLARKFGA